MTKDKTTQNALKLTKIFFKDMDKVVNDFYKAMDLMKESIHKTEAQLYISKHGQYGVKTPEENQEAELLAMYQKEQI